MLFLSCLPSHPSHVTLSIHTQQQENIKYDCRVVQVFTVEIWGGFKVSVVHVYRFFFLSWALSSCICIWRERKKTTNNKIIEDHKKYYCWKQSVFTTLDRFSRLLNVDHFIIYPRLWLRIIHTFIFLDEIWDGFLLQTVIQSFEFLSGQKIAKMLCAENVITSRRLMA